MAKHIQYPVDLDITEPDGPVEVQICRDGTVLWVNLEGRCVLRACRISELIVDDQRPMADSLTEFWVEHYKSGQCDLCGNRGYLLNHKAQRMYCFCPNGQVLRENKVPLY